MKVRAVSITHGADGDNAESLIVYCARVSSPQNQANKDTGPKLLRYLIQHRHWSPFEMAGLCVEIETSRAIAAQILRHRSFSFQEFSQRYAEVDSIGVESYSARRQDTKNRQNSFDDMSVEDKEWFEKVQAVIWIKSYNAYKAALLRGIAKESARMLLPLGTRTTLLVNGTVRSWIHYLQARCTPETQKEHRDIAEAIKAIFVEQFPTIAEALEWRTSK